MDDAEILLYADIDPDESALSGPLRERNGTELAVETTTNAGDALALLEAEPVTCVVSAYELDDTTGIDFLEAVRDRYPTLPFVLYPRNGSEAIASEAISRGVSEYVPKPNGSDDWGRLADRIVAALDGVSTEPDSAPSQSVREPFTAAGVDRLEDQHKLDQLERLVDTLPGIVYRVENDPDWPIIWIEGECEGITGYPQAALERNEVTFGEDLIVPEDHDDVWETVQAALEAGEPFEHTFRIDTRDGTRKWIWERGEGVYDADGELLGIEGFHTDVTERVQSTRQLRAERDFITQALDVLDDLFYVVGESGEIRRANRRLSEVTGYNPKTVGTMRAVEFFPADERGRIADAIEETFETGHTVVESELLNADGERIPYEFTGARLTDTDGKITGLVGVGRDVSERKARERALARQREQLAALNSLNAVFRDVTGAVIERSTREEIECVACEKLAASDSYAFAWIADVEPGSSTLLPHTEAGVDGFVESADVRTVSEPEPGRESDEISIRHRAVTVSGNVFEDSAFGPWRALAERFGFSSVITIPIVYDETHFGVLGIHAKRTDAFAPEERAIFRRLGEVLGYAFYALERKEKLGSAIQLTFRSESFVDMLSTHGAADCDLRLETIVPLDGRTDEFLEYWTVGEGNAEAFRSAVDAHNAKVDPTLVSVVDGTARFEVAAGSGSMSSAFDAAGGTLRSASLEGDALVLVGEFPETVDPEAVTDALVEAISGTELVSHQRVLTPQYLRRMVEETLTERQRTVLQLAHHGEYFDHPRKNTGDDLAAHLDITRQTFHHHLRNAQSAVFDVLFDEPSDPVI